MEIVFSLLTTLLIPVLVIAGVVFLVRRGRGGDDHEVDEVDDGVGSVRRAFVYGLAFVSLMFAGSGVAMLLGGLFEALSGDRVIADSDSQLAISLAFTVVGVPSWVVFLALAQRSLRQHPGETRSSLRWGYLGAARGVALLIVLVRGVGALEALFRDGTFDGGAWGWALIWAAVWGLHEALARSAAPTGGDALSLDRLYRAFGAVIGLYVFGGGLVSSLALPALSAYDAFAGETLVARGGWFEGTALATLLLGGATWWWHWFVGLRRDQSSPWWDIHVFLFGILTAVYVAVYAAAIVLYLTLEWIIGDPLSDSTAHFRGVITPLVFVVVGGSSWAYHRLVLSEARDAVPGVPRSEAERVYRYLVAAAGLVTLAVGVATVFAMAIDVVLPSGETFRQDEWARDELTLAITLLAVGGPLWARYWFAAQAMVATAPAEELAAPSRRLFVFGVFGVAILVAIVNLIVLLFEFFDAVLGEGVGTQVVRDARWSIAMLLTAGAVSTYYWFVLREQQEATPEATANAPRRVLREVTLIGAGEGVVALRDALAADGVRVRVWRRVDLDGAAAPEADTQTLRAQLVASAHARVVVVFGRSGTELVPYESDAER